jgi:MFS family permease
MANRRATNSMRYAAQGSTGACIMDIITLVAFIISIYLAGRIAERRGRRFKSWAGIAAIIGPLALPLVFLFPNLHDKNGGHA